MEPGSEAVLSFYVLSLISVVLLIIVIVIRIVAIKKKDLRHNSNILILFSAGGAVLFMALSFLISRLI